MKPKIFIGSSSEGLEIAQALELRLKSDYEVTVWDEGVFALTQSTLDSLIKRLNYFDFAVFVLSPDDVTQRRNVKLKSARDNVIFELGLFMGPLGRERTFVVLDPNKVTIPTDLLGVTFASYDSERRDGNITAAVSPAATMIRQAVRQLGLRWSSATAAAEAHADLGGLAAYYVRYPTAEMIETMARATDEIRIVQTWISNWNDLCQAMSAAFGIPDGHARKSKLRARVVLIDPESPLCEARGIHSGQRPGSTRVLAQTSLDQLQLFKERHELPDARLEIRLSNELPTFAMFAADDIVYFNPYLRDRNTYQSPCFRFHRRETGFSRELSDHFESLWRAAPSSLTPEPAPKRRRATRVMR